MPLRNFCCGGFLIKWCIRPGNYLSRCCKFRHRHIRLGVVMRSPGQRITRNCLKILKWNTISLCARIDSRSIRRKRCPNALAGPTQATYRQIRKWKSCRSLIIASIGQSAWVVSLSEFRYWTCKCVSWGTKVLSSCQNRPQSVFLRSLRNLAMLPVCPRWECCLHRLPQLTLTTAQSALTTEKNPLPTVRTRSSSWGALSMFLRSTPLHRVSRTGLALLVRAHGRPGVVSSVRRESF